TYIGRLCIGVDEMEGDGFSVGQNVPNPTSGFTVIPYRIPESGMISFRLSNSIGQEIIHRQLFAEPGSHQMEVDIHHLPAGIYHYQIEYNGLKISKKMVISR
ncbi:MAG TPA: T9SS type A sorting domain-containing protein, partial [Bacteroidales bacterium]|nr:T9SS type A sorting domain-containing protein [Bacteroidales bacterium]